MRRKQFTAVMCLYTLAFLLFLPMDQVGGNSATDRAWSSKKFLRVCDSDEELHMEASVSVRPKGK